MKKTIVGVLLFLAVFLYGDYRVIYSPTFYQFYIEYSNEINPEFPTIYYSHWAEVPPSIDGIMSEGEWDNATTIDITIPEEETVLLYILNDDNYIYIAVEANDYMGDSPEEVGIYFDTDMNGVWNDDGSEGNFWFTSTSGPALSPGPGIFRSIIDPCSGETPENAIGTYHAFHFDGSKSVIEIMIDRANSPLLLDSSVDTVSFWAYYFDYEGLAYHGDLNMILKRGLWCSPSDYPKLVLASEATNIEELTEISPSFKVTPTLAKKGEPIKFALETTNSAQMRLAIYDVIGRRVFARESVLSGSGMIIWIPQKPGIYFFVLQSEKFLRKGKIEVIH